jgi:hypothetical protein
MLNISCSMFTELGIMCLTEPKCFKNCIMLENVDVDSTYNARECDSAAWYLEATRVKLILIPIFFLTAELRVQLIYILTLYLHQFFVVNTYKLP